MFQQARLQLTTWYLLLIMALCMAFSTFIYRVIILQVERFSQTQQFRIERRFYDLGLPPPEIDFITEARHGLLTTLITVNGVILVISGGLAYLLAGRTLNPIRQMVDEQNQFISDASHEFRTPLTALKAAMEVNLRDNKLTLKEAKVLISENIQDVNKLQALSDALLQLAQFQNHTGRVRFETVSLDIITGQALHRVKPFAVKKRITLKNSTTAIKFQGDPDSLVDLLVILLDNAIKYSPPASPVSLESQRLDGHVAISVRDNGIGIDPKDIPFIFDRFYRSDSARSKNGTGGYGLGLAIAKKIIDTHRGSITVQSQPGQGAVFTVKIPV